MMSPFTELKTIRSLTTLLLALVFLLSGLPIRSVAQESEVTAAKERFEQALLKGRALAKEVRNISLNFFNSSLADSYQWKDKWPTAAKKLADHKDEFEQAAIDWFFEVDTPPEKLLKVVSAISTELYNSGDYETSWKLMQKIEKFYPVKNDILLKRRMALLAVKTNRYDHAVSFLRLPDAREAIEKLEFQVDKNMLMLSPLLAQNWEREKEIRAEEARADDLPRVKIQLTTGEVIVELFENEAPEAVANFISLVESGYYDDAVCHPVMKNLVAQTGMFNRSHNIPIDYRIKNESRSANARKHFVGSLSMNSFDGGKESSATMFGIMLLPNPEIDYNGEEDDKISQPVFGRVVSGLNHVMELPATMEIDEETQKEAPVKGVKPGFIEKATVIRKRDHEYKFEKIRREKKKEQDQN